MSNSAIFQHRFLQNINKLYKHSGKCDDQQQLKDILEDAVVSITEGLINNSPIYPMTPALVKKPSAIKSLCLFTNILDVKKKTDICRVGATKLRRKANKSGTTPWAMEKKRQINQNINNQIKRSLCDWIIRHPQVVKSPILLIV